MCGPTCIAFGEENIKQFEIEGKRVLEVGSRDVNGSLRPFIENFKPAEYIGVDIIEGKKVDRICDVYDIVETFGKESMDFVLSTEMLEHVEDWRKVISNLKGVLRVEGAMLLTTRSIGFPLHSYPADYWRYQVEDMQVLFSDFVVEVLEKDKRSPGVFLKAKKPKDFKEVVLSGHQLYSIIQKKCMK